MSKKELKQYSEKDKVEVGLDEAGRGCLFGPVCVAGVVWLNEDPEDCVEIKDSKKCTEKHRNRCYDYIREKSISYSIHMIDNDEIDRENILKSSLKGMHQCLDSIGSEVNFDIILVDGNHFNTYYDKDMSNYEPLFKLNTEDSEKKNLEYSKKLEVILKEYGVDGKINSFKSFRQSP